jgi:hypothetical protein
MAKDPAGSRSDESTQFSLKELLRLEDDRVAQQARERAARELEAARQREVSLRRREDEAASRARAEAAEAERRQREARGEMARREAMQKAIVEQSRLEVETRARAEERELERRHEIEMARLRGDAGQASLGALLGAVLLGGVVMMGVCVAIHFVVFAPAARHRIAELAARADSSAARADEFERTLGEAQRTKLSLDRRIGELEAEVARLETVPTKGTVLARPPTRTMGKARIDRPASDPCGGPGDPLCPTIGR